jgi:hypothetical protein
MICRRYGFLYFSVPNESGLLGGRNGSSQQFATLARLKKMGLTPGVSDLVLGHQGRMFALEVKVGKGVQSENQKRFEAWCKECGIPYAVVHGVDDVTQKLKEWGIMT